MQSRQMPQGSPYFDSLILYGQSVIAPLAGGAPNTGALANPHGLPMEIYEIRFNVYPNNSAANRFDYIAGLGLSVKLDMGGLALVDAKVPVSGFGNYRDTAPLTTSAEFLTDAAVSTFPATFSWRLKYPLFVPAGAVVTPTFSHLGQNPFDATAEVTYFCRTLPVDFKPPAQVMVPWVSAWLSKSYDQVSAAGSGTELSNESDIGNPFNVPLEISRLVGNMNLTYATGAIEDFGDFRFRLGRVAIRSSRGDEIVRAKTLFSTLFSYDWLAWDIPGSFIMRPGEFYKVLLATEAVDYSPETTGQLGREQFSITAVGYRPISTKALIQAAQEAK